MTTGSPGWAKRSVIGLLGSRPVSSISRRVSRGALRVLAYHGVPDPKAFEQQLQVLSSEYTPVNGAAVVSHLRGEVELPTDSIWVTFDDGLADVVEFGLPLLLKHGVPASMFVCPGLVDTGQDHWWDVVSRASDLGWVLSNIDRVDLLHHLKSLPDPNRRMAVAEAETFLTRHSVLRSPGPANLDQLRHWHSNGMEIGNHTWDHPCLDRCDRAEQRRQIKETDDWLQAFGAFDTTRLFAYPNGDWTEISEGTLRDLGYDLALLFDHRLSAIDDCDPLRVSRLRIDSDASISRLRAVASGGHPTVFGIASGL